jgi:hypothetical protein
MDSPSRITILGFTQQSCHKSSLGVSGPVGGMGIFIVYYKSEGSRKARGPKAREGSGSDLVCGFFVGQYPTQFLIQLSEPLPNRFPLCQPTGEPPRQIRHAVRARNTQHISELRVGRRRVPPRQVRQRRSGLVPTPPTAQFAQLQLIGSTDDFADPPQLETLDQSRLATSLSRRSATHQLPQARHEVLASQHPAVVRIQPR